MEIVSIIFLYPSCNTDVQKRKTNVLPPNLSSHPRNPKIQHPGLQTKVCLFLISCYSPMQFLTFLGWSNSKRPFAKCAKSSACGNNAATPSRRQTSRKRGCCRRTTRHESVADTEKWRVRNRKGDDMYALYDVWVFYCIVSFGKGGIGKCLPPSCAWQVDRKRDGVWEPSCLALWRMEIGDCLIR